MKNVLVINAGSSSLKYQLINMKDESVIAKGLVERIGIDGSVIKHRPCGKDQTVIEKPMKDHVDGMAAVLSALTDKEHGVIADLTTIKAVGHRVVHGGEKFFGSVIINNEVMDAIRENCEIAPLHNPANIMGIEACQNVMPGVPMVAVFDTAFHAKMPRQAYLYGLEYEAYSKYKVRRYGFHGTSHSYVSKRAAAILGKDVNSLKIITCHLGNGSSIAAVKNGVSVDTSMGYTPLEGLVMGTRSGDIDASIVPILMTKMNMSADEAIGYLNKKCGVLGLSGVSSDFRDLSEAADGGNERAKAALEVFIYKIRKYIGSYAAAMGGVDVITFAGGIGENDPVIRKACITGLEFMGAQLNDSRNDGLRSKEAVISTDSSRVTVMVVPTDEELVIARDTCELALCGK